MPGWGIVIIGLAILAALVLAVRKWGQLSVERRVLERNIKAAKTRKAIDDEIQKLTPDELADELRNSL